MLVDDDAAPGLLDAAEPLVLLEAAPPAPDDVPPAGAVEDDEEEPPGTTTVVDSFFVSVAVLELAGGGALGCVTTVSLRSWQAASANTPATSNTQALVVFLVFKLLSLKRLERRRRRCPREAARIMTAAKRITKSAGIRRDGIGREIGRELPSADWPAAPQRNSYMDRDVARADTALTDLPFKRAPLRRGV